MPADGEAHFQHLQVDTSPNPSAKLPKLHDLTLEPYSRAYDIGRKPRHIWTRCLDFSQLRCLDLGIGCPGTFIEQLVGNVPKLRSLTLGIKHGVQDRRNFSCEDPRLVERFIESVDSLHELSITNYCTDPSFLFAAMQKYYRSLEAISFHTPPDGRLHDGAHCELPPVWTVDQIMEVYDQCPNLSNLELDVALVEGQWVGGVQKLATLTYSFLSRVGMLQMHYLALVIYETW